MTDTFPHNTSNSFKVGVAFCPRQAMKAEGWKDTGQRGTLASAVTVAAQAQQAVTSNTCTASLVPLLSTTVSKSSVCRLFAIQSLGRKEKHLLFLLNWCCALNSFYPAGGPWESSDGGEVPTHLFWFGPRGQLGTMQPLAPSLLPPQGWGEEDKTKGSGIETRTMRDGPPVMVMGKTGEDWGRKRTSI